MNQALVTGPRAPTGATAQLFGRYRISRTLAFGGMAQILLATDGATGNQVVVKRILPQYAQNPEFVQFFIHEGRLGTRLKHPNLVDTLDAGQIGDTPYIALEYLRGQPCIELLRAAARAHVDLPLGAAVRIVADTARGLHHAHIACGDDGQPLGVVHRDVTPHNLFVCESGVTKVLDFGIAKAASQLHETRTGTIKGKFAYLAPEQIRGQPIDRRVDVFALGIVLYELLTMKPLFRGKNDGETLQRVLEFEVPPPERVRAGVPPGLGAVALRALQRDPERRLPSAEALADSIEAVAAAECIDASHEVVAELLAELCPTERLDPRAEEATPNPPEAELNVDPELLEIDDVAPAISVGLSTGSQAAMRARDAAEAASSPGGVGHTVARARRQAARAALVVSAGVLAIGIGLRSRSCLRHEAAAVGPALVEPAREAPARGSAMEHGASTARGSAPERAAVDALNVRGSPNDSAKPLAPEAAPLRRPAPAGPREATLKIQADGAPNFVVDGHAQRPAADGLFHLAPGRHAIVVSSSLLAQPRTLTVELQPEEAAVRSVRGGRGQLRVAISPWAEVSVDGKVLGVTPLAPVELAEGAHTVTLKNSDLGVTTKKRVTITPNKEFVLRADLFAQRGQ